MLGFFSSCQWSNWIARGLTSVGIVCVVTVVTSVVMDTITILEDMKTLKAKQDQGNSFGSETEIANPGNYR